ncbi:MAG: DivIVA domain-containing protein [Tepidibacillus sp.]
MLTPEDIFEKEFKRSIRGYDVDEVNEFLDQVIQDYSRLIEENKALKKENQQLKSNTTRQSYHAPAPTPEESITLQDLVKRVEILEKKTRFL